MADTRVLDKIKKLLNLAANDAAHEGEVENALRFARKLMDEHGLTQEEVDAASSPGGSSRLVTEMEAIDLAVSAYNYDLNLGNATCKVCDVRMYSRWSHVIRPEDGRYIKHEHIVFYGLERDVATAKALFLELRVTLKSMARFRCGAGWKSAHRDYARGFSLGLYHKACRMRDLSQQEAAPGAMILAKDALIARFAIGLGLGKRKSQVQRIGFHGSLGSQDAQKVDLGTSGITGRPQGRLA